MSANLRYKLASEPWEFDAIHRLNYRSFVEEIPQHAPNANHKLVDRFHAENTYAICLEGDELVGMIAGRCNRPFSLDGKLPNLDAFLPPHTRVVEIRLLSVIPRYRKKDVFVRLAGFLARHFCQQGCDLAIISGTLRQIKLYTHLGFHPFGPQVGSEDAPYQPMALTLESFAIHADALVVKGGGKPVSFLPLSMDVADSVCAALAAPPLYHRTREFAVVLDRVRKALCGLSGAVRAIVMNGSGTLANDAVAAQLAGLAGRGAVLVNGEFGQRLVDHARRWSLEFDQLESLWGEPIDMAQVARLLARGQTRWLWAVVGETSTGVVNRYRELQALCSHHGVDLCLDAISALGLCHVDLTGVRLATGVSGKALGAYPGLAVVYHDGRLRQVGEIPRYMDLAAYEAAEGIPYTLSSNLLAALDAALQGRDWAVRLKAVAEADTRFVQA